MDESDDIISLKREEVPPTSGFLYCLHNPAFTLAYGSNIYKFGLAQNPASRLDGYITSYIDPSRFVYVSECVYDCRKAELLLFKKLRYSRIKDNREFFWCRSDMIKELFEEVVEKINEGQNFEVPPQKVGASYLGTIPHLRIFFSDEFTIANGERVSGSRIETIYKDWCSRKKCKPLKDLKEYSKDIKINLEYNISTNSSEWWIYDIKPQSKEPLVEEYISQWWRVIPIHDNDRTNNEIYTKWNTIVTDFRVWYNKHIPNSDVPIDTLWYCFQKYELKCSISSVPVGILQHVFGSFLPGTTIKSISELSNEVVNSYVNNRVDINILGLQKVLSSEDALITYISEETKQESVYMIHLDLLYSHYIKWGKQRGHELLDREIFIKSLKEKDMNIYKSMYIKGVKLKGEKDQCDFVTEYISETCIVDIAFKCRFKDLIDGYNEWTEARNRLGCEASHFSEILVYRGFVNNKDGSVKWIEGLTIKEKVREVLIPLNRYLEMCTQPASKKQRAATLDQLQKDLRIKGRIRYKLSLLLVCSDNTIISYPNRDNLEKQWKL